MKSLCVYQRYLRTAHMHVFGWSVGSSHIGVSFLNNVYWVWFISLAISLGCVRMWPCELCRHSSELWVVGWNIFVDGFGFSV